MKIEQLNNPKVSVLVPVYNHEHYLEACLLSIFNQKTEFKYEVIILNDKSTDNSSSRIYELIHSNTNSNCTVQFIDRKQNKGMVATIIELIEAAQSNYVAFCEGDDYWVDPTKLQEQYELLSNNNNASLCYTNYDILHELKSEKHKNREAYTNKMPSGFLINEVFKGSFPWTVTAMFNKTFLNLELKELLKPHYKMCDFPMWIELAANGEFLYLDKVTAVYRRNAESTTANANSTLAKIRFNLSWIDIYTANYFRIKNKLQNRVQVNHIAFNIRVQQTFSMLIVQSDQDRKVLLQLLPKHHLNKLLTYKNTLFLKVVKNNLSSNIIKQIIILRNRIKQML